MRVFALFLFPLSLVAASAAQSQSAPPAPKQPMTIYEAFGIKPPGLRGAELEAAVRAAEGEPLGSARNPVRTRGIGGQRAYLARLRCPDGKAPNVLGRAPSMPSPFGGVGDTYAVTCGEIGHKIEMDLYHEHVELRPVPGFTIVAP